MTSLRERFHKLLFNRAVGGVLQTPPLPPGDRPFAALSMVHTRDVASYLLAIKSFAAQTRPGRIVLVADPSLTAADRGMLRSHVPHIEIVDAAGFRRAALPVGGCWERLAAIAALSHETAIVQVDADTVTTGPLDDLIEPLLQGRSSLLSSEAGIRIVPLDEAARFGRTLLGTSQHIQVLFESRLDELPDAASWRYARGCAGFTAFARGALTPERLDAVSATMRQLHGPRWDDWGSEQATSNLLAASAPGAWLLPHPAYCNADSRASQTRLTHYIGYARFTSRAYEHDARRLIARWGRGVAP